jgi:hypothetical protein
MSSVKIDSIDAAWLAENVSGKELLKAVGKLMGKKRSKKASGDGDSTSSKPVSEALQLQHERTKGVAALLKTFKQEVKDDEREFDGDIPLQGLTFKVVSYLKTQETIDEVIEAEDVDAVAAAVQFLAENPEWKAKKPAKAAAKSKGKKAEVELSDSEDDEPKAKPKKAAAKPKEVAKKPAAKPLVSDSESEEEAPKPKAKAAAKPAAKPKKAEVELSDSEDEAPKPKAKEAAKPKAEKPKKAESDSEEEKPKPKAKAKATKGTAAAGGAAAAGPRLDDMIKITHEERGELSWDQEGDGSLYDAAGKRVGSTTDGEVFNFA